MAALPRVFFDVSADGTTLGRIVVEVTMDKILAIYLTPVPGRRDIAKTTLSDLVLSVCVSTSHYLLNPLIFLSHVT